MPSTKMAVTQAQHTFARVPQVEIQRSVFNRSFGHKTTFNGGWLIPVLVDEALPGDTFHLTMHGFGRITTLLRPIMDNLWLDTFFFFVPNRLIWANWQKAMGQQNNPGDSIDFLAPQVTAPVGGWTELSIGDYMGIPTKITPLPVSALPMRAYNLIWNEWFRDQNLQSSASVPTGDGPDGDGNYVLRRRGKRHDYFTSSLPWTQKGTAVPLPLGSSAPVKTQVTDLVTGAQAALNMRRASDGATGISGDLGTSNSVQSNVGWSAGAFTVSAGAYPANLYADLAGATASTVNALRQAFQIQRLLERDARAGTRYTEIVKAHFGVTSPDARLQRPEYLGGSSVRLGIREVDATNETATLALGEQAGNGIFSFSRPMFRQSFTEHGFVIGMVSIRADLNYQQGLDRMWSRRSRYDWYWPVLANLGEQAVLNKEIYAQGNASDDLVFGYQERYAEYRYKPSIITGRLRSNAATPLDSWHLAQKYTALPALNATFIEDNPPIDRVVAVLTEPQFIADFFFDYRCARPMPVFSVPGMIDHF